MTSELWNFKKGRKATLKEVICHMEELRHKKKAPDLPKLAEKEKKEDANKVGEIGKQHKFTKMNSEVLKGLADEARLAQQTVVELKEDLEKKKEEKKDLQALWIQHTVKEQELKSELTEVREQLIVGLADVLDENSSIQLKKLGEIDQIAFERACKGIFGSDFATTKAAELRSFWQEKLECQLWHPFKLVISGAEDVRGILDVEDKTLQELRSQWGKEIYELVTTAFKEGKDCDPSSRKMELWNCICKRKATFMEAFHFMLGRIEKEMAKEKLPILRILQGKHAN